MSDNFPCTTVVAWYRNHFDLIWRRGWRRAYEYQGGTWRPYADVQEACLDCCLRLAEERGAAFVVEQALTLREYLRRHPEAADPFRRLAQQGRFELLGAGEAIIDTNMCHAETLVRNLASGLHWGEQLLGVPARAAAVTDAFGTSAQLPQVIRGCGLRAAEEFSYSVPDAPYWRGLDGSTVFIPPALPGRHFFYDHCYHEPCRICHGAREVEGMPCADCEGTGFDLPQNWYPPREPVETEAPWAVYALTSEEMLPDPEMVVEIERLNSSQDRYRYEWGTPRRYWQELYAEAEALVGASSPTPSPAGRGGSEGPPADQISSRVENNPTQTGCLVSRSRIKRAARAAEGAFYVTETLASLAEMRGGARLDAAVLEQYWLLLPLLFFHDAITGTHNDVAQQELLDYAAQIEWFAGEVNREVLRVAGGHPALPPAEGAFTVAVGNGLGWEGDYLVTVPLPSTPPLLRGEEAGGEALQGYRVTDPSGAEMPVYADPTYSEPHLERLCPVGPDRRGSRRPHLTFLAKRVPPGGWKSYTVNPVSSPSEPPLPQGEGAGGEAANDLFRLTWDDHGVTLLEDTRRGQVIGRAGNLRLGEIVLEQDIGDPWGTRDLEHRARRPLARDTRLLGARRWGGVQEVFFAGRMENRTFGREEVPRVFGLWWYEVWRLYDGLPRVDVDLEVFWRGLDHRLRLVFPTDARDDTGWYSIPGGVLERPRYEMTETNLWSPNGDWPAVYFVSTQPAGDRPGLAVINTGTPSARIEDGVVMYSLLRGVSDPFCLGRYAQDYPMPTAELMDGGYHRYRFALMSVAHDPVCDGVLTEALRMNLPAVAEVVEQPISAEGIAVEPSCVAVSAVKRSFDGSGWAVRLVNYAAEPVRARLTLPREGLSAERTNLLEREGAAMEVRGRAVEVEMRGYEIGTVVVRG